VPQAFQLGLNLVARQFAGSADPIRTELGIQRHETILVGSKTIDMQAGVCGGSGFLDSRIS
jgi:hypothetical protein